MSWNEPCVGEIWQWRRDDSKSDEIYGPGVVVGTRPGWDFNSRDDFITFQFSEKGVMNIPLPMVRRFMYLVIQKD